MIVYVQLTCQNFSTKFWTVSHFICGVKGGWWSTHTVRTGHNGHPSHITWTTCHKSVQQTPTWLYMYNIPMICLAMAAAASVVGTGVGSVWGGLVCPPKPRRYPSHNTWTTCRKSVQRTPTWLYVSFFVYLFTRGIILSYFWFCSCY